MSSASAASVKQSRLMSLIEAIANVVVGYGIAVATQLAIFPWFGLPARVSDALAIGSIFTLVSLIRGYLLRRVFETVRARTMKRQTAALALGRRLMPDDVSC